MFRFALILLLSLRCVLPTQQVNTIAQDSLGCIWLGGEDGLQRFDGYGLQDYLTAQQVPYFGYINRIYSERDSYLLCTNDGLFRYNYITNDLCLVAPETNGHNITSYYSSTTG